jgi:xanthine/uracil permease
MLRQCCCRLAPGDRTGEAGDVRGGLEACLWWPDPAAVLMSGVATIMFLLIVNGKVPSYLGTSAAFVAAVAAIRAQGGNSADVTGAILIAGLILAAVGVIVHFGGSGYVRAVLPPVVTGAVVMLIGFSLATVATTTHQGHQHFLDHRHRHRHADGDHRLPRREAVRPVAAG